MSDALAPLLAHWPAGARFAVLTGAGCSTDAGIPDYRDEAGEWKHARPVQYQDFMREHAVRQRYWARSMLGWPRMAHAAPAAAHHALARIEAAGALTGLITQNVDTLHERAGSRATIDLHGRLDAVACQNCNLRLSRADWQHTISARNPGWADTVADIRDAPDGDAILAGADYSTFVVPDCPRCGGVVKPDVVFFGENVPRDRVDRAYQWVDEADGLLVAGTSLMVFSGLRFVRRAAAGAKPVLIVNRGVTRGDDLATAKVSDNVGDVLGGLADRLADRLALR